MQKIRAQRWQCAPVAGAEASGENHHDIRNFVEIASKKAEGWIDYRWPNPVTEVIESKSTYIEKVQDLVVGCGIYKG